MTKKIPVIEYEKRALEALSQFADKLRDKAPGWQHADAQRYTKTERAIKSLARAKEREAKS